MIVIGGTFRPTEPDGGIDADGDDTDSAESESVDDGSASHP